MQHGGSGVDSLSSAICASILGNRKGPSEKYRLREFRESGRAMQWEIIYLLAAVLLLPLVPAYILYKTLPSRTTVTGPFRGLNIQLTGAFGGYFLLVLFSSGFLYYQKPATEFHYNITFPLSSFPEDLNDTGVFVFVKRRGKGGWSRHEQFEKKPTPGGIMVSIKDLHPQDTLYIHATYDNDEWETTTSVTVPLDHLDFRPGHKRGIFP